MDTHSTKIFDPNNIDEKRSQILFVETREAHHSMNIKKVIYEGFFPQMMMLKNWIESVV
jgi:hypothetical protein